MDLCEIDGKSLLAAHGVGVPRSRLIDAASCDAAALAREFPDGAAVKAQLLSGGRGKQGLVRLATADAIGATVAEVAGRLAADGLPQRLLIEEKLEIATQYYLSFSIDDTRGCPLLLFSTQGGIDVEESGAIASIAIDPLRGLFPHDLISFFRDRGVAPASLGALCRAATALFRAFVTEDAELLEINPLALTANGRFVPLDAKVTLDEAAELRHGRRFDLSAQLADAGRTPLEREAAALEFTFVEMSGDVALMSAGAGLGMALIDLLGDAGLHAACFVDGSSATTADNTAARIAHVFKRAAAPDVRAIMFYQNLGSRDLKPRVHALLDLLRATPPPKPLYCGLLATYLAERNMTTVQACEALRQAGCYATSDLRQLIATLKSDLAGR